MPSPLVDEHKGPVDAETLSAAAPRTQLTPNDWVRAATDLLVTKSIDAVRVDVLAKQLDVTRGSFYWHFKNRDDLLNQVLQDWVSASTKFRLPEPVFFQLLKVWSPTVKEVGQLNSVFGLILSDSRPAKPTKVLNVDPGG